MNGIIFKPIISDFVFLHDCPILVLGIGRYLHNLQYLQTYLCYWLEKEGEKMTITGIG